MHARAICVEDTRNLDVEPMLPVIIEKQRFSASLALVIAGAQSDRVHIAPVALRLGVLYRIAVNLACGGLKYARAETFGETQHVDRPVDRYLRRLNRIVLIVDGRSGAGQIVNEVHFDKQREADIVSHKFKAGMV